MTTTFIIAFVALLLSLLSGAMVAPGARRGG